MDGVFRHGTSGEITFCYGAYTIQQKHFSFLILFTFQYAQAGIAATVWNYLKKNYPEFIGETNPFNRQIVEIFRDQGGH